MNTIFIFSQNVKLNSFEMIRNINKLEEVIFITPHMLLKNEKEFLCKVFGKCLFYKFADFISDAEGENCDVVTYNSELTVEEYYNAIKEYKNSLICKKIINLYPEHMGYICSDDLGIDSNVWLEQGFHILELEYYHMPGISEPIEKKCTIKDLIKKIPGVMQLHQWQLKKRRYSQVTEEIYVSTYENKKYVFIGKLPRIEYRMNMEWKKSEEEYQKLKIGKFEKGENCQYLSTLHEKWKCTVPDDKKYDVRYIQDGYLPPNYSSRYLKYKPKNVKYYAWDDLGKEIFKNHDEPVSIMPFRKKLFLPKMQYKNELKTILVATSGPGDWTALKNRSDEDLMLQAFVDVALRCPKITIIYRCHPTWTHPAHNGVNSINRAAEYINFSGANNMRISGNIPKNKEGETVLSFSRNSFEEDLACADMVFGEHSVSMLDAGFKGIPFASVNLTNRRNLFEGITNIGFPHCTSVDDIVDLLESYGNDMFKSNYDKAIINYNAMTDINE